MGANSKTMDRKSIKIDRFGIRNTNKVRIKPSKKVYSRKLGKSIEIN